MRPHTRIVRHIGLVLVLLSGSCGAPSSSDSDTATAEQAPPAADTVAAGSELPSRDEFVREGLRPLGQSRAEITRTLGEPDSITSRVVPNRHAPGVQDTLFTLYYPGLIAHFHRSGAGGEFLTDAVVSSNRYLRYPAVGIGATHQQLQGALGMPDEVPDSVYVYSCHTDCMGAEEPVRLYLENDRVRRIRFSYYVD